MNDTFLKWAGGKHWFVHNYHSYFPKDYNRYIEPFLGGGSVFFHMQPDRAYLSDVNSELISTYIAIRDEVDAVYSHLQYHQTNNSKEHYYSVRKKVPATTAEQAARMIYLNKTCFNGIYRVNKKGEFNVPYGTERELSFDKDSLLRSSSALQNAEIFCQDFQHAIDISEENDLLFCDPPYTVLHEDSRFIGYNADVFSWDDQIRLAQALTRAKDRGVKIIMTNVDHPTVRALFENTDGFSLDSVERSCFIAGSVSGRKKYKELIISANTR